MKKQYYKNKLLIFLMKPFENKRLFTPLSLAILTLKDFKLWPEKLIALDAFSQTGLQWTRAFYKEAAYLEMWDLDAEAIKYAKKSFSNATITCGDSIDALIHKKFTRTDFNFILIDSPVPFIYPDGTFEHFSFFNSIFQNAANKCVIIMDVVPDIRTMLSIHPSSDDFIKKWSDARADFYRVEDGVTINPTKMIEVYTQKVVSLGYNANLISYNARNKYFGFITIAISK